MKVIKSDKVAPLFRLLLMNNPYADAIIRDVQELVELQSVDPIRAAGGCRCGECSFGRKPHAEDMQDGYVYCQEQSKYMSADDFCSGGEPREEHGDE